MIKQLILVCPVEDLRQFIVNDDDDNIVVNIIDTHFTFRKNVFKQHKGIFFMLPSKRVFFDTLPFEVAQILTEDDVVKLVDYIHEQGLETPEEEAMARTASGFLETFIIKDIVFRTVDSLVLETAVECIAKDMPGLRIKHRDDNVVIIQEGGDVIDVTGEAFQTLIKESLVKKSITVLEKPSNAAMVKMLKQLGIIDEIVLKRKKIDLMDAFTASAAFSGE